MSKDFRKNLPPEAQAIFEKAQAAKTKQNRKQSEIEVNGTTYVIKKWKNTECIDRIPNFANLIYVPMMGTAIEDEMSESGASPSLMLDMMFRRLQDIDMLEFFKDSLDNTFVKGSDTPVDLDEDFESPTDIITVLEAVFDVNFFVHSCSLLFKLGPQIAGMQELQDKIQTN